MSTTSKRIQEGMELRGFKQADLVEKTGISKGALSSYISGRYIPRQNNTFLIAKALNVSEAWLMGADVPIDRIDTSSGNQSSGQKELNKIYDQLSSHNQDKVLTYSKSLLTKQQLDDEVYEVAAAHAINASPEQKKHADDIMKDPSEWE